MVVAAVVLLSLWQGADPAAAHYVYAQGYVYRTSTHCTWGRAEISHGSGGGYTKVSVGGVAAIARNCVPWAAASAKVYWPGQARVLTELWKRQSNGSWSRCRSSGWKYNPYTIGANSLGWVPTYDYAVNYGRTPPCGSGTYGVTGYMQVYQSGAWRGGKLNGGQHKLPA
jgi:hypothetical protein